MDLGTNLKSIRESKKVSRKELAKRMNVTPTTITRYENGDRNLNFDTLSNFLINISDSESEYLKLFYSIIIETYKNSLKESTEQTRQALDYLKKYANTWREDFLNVSKYPSNLLSAILDYLENTEDYFTFLSVYHPEYNNDKHSDLEYFTDEQINNIISKVTDLVKYEIYKIENDIK